MTRSYFQPLGCPSIDTTERVDREVTEGQLVPGLALRLADSRDAGELCAARRDEYLWRVFGSGVLISGRLSLSILHAEPPDDRPLGDREEFQHGDCEEVLVGEPASGTSPAVYWRGHDERTASR